ncbi:hypothetical protein GCM10009665_66050 [Kitasatospora nipponensis]|uniref:Uncharacterized protein n=2 Tax=Kitasatospora nipponensis TaxID=258049 RepID=A0ABN1WVL5_9ACTN
MPEPTERDTAERKADQGRRIDLTLAQVTASALAAVVGAVLASELGVYGTVIGAAVVSIGATTGGALFQHAFRRTGEQLREVADRGPGRSVNDLRQAPPADTEPAASGWHPPGAGEWTDSPVLRARRRWTWRTYAAVSALVFALAMTPIVGVELAAGRNLHSITTGQDGSGTSVFPREERRPQPAPSRPAGGAGAGSSPSPQDRGPTPTSPSPGSSASPFTGASPATGPATPAPAGTPTPSPTPSPSPGTGSPSATAPSTTPSPSASAPASAGQGAGAGAAVADRGTPSP